MRNFLPSVDLKRLVKLFIGNEGLTGVTDDPRTRENSNFPAAASTQVIRFIRYKARFARETRV
jgi:hypothetical protein